VQKAQNIPDQGFTDYSNVVLDKGIRAQGASIPRDAWNHFIGRMSYNLNKNGDQTLAMLAALQELLAHNSGEYDSTAEYAPGDVCYTVGNGENFNLKLWYQRITQTPAKIINIPPTTTLHWKPVFPALGQPQLPALHFTQASQLANIVSGERLETLLGKMQKWYTELAANIGFKAHPVGSYYTQYPAAESNDFEAAFPAEERPDALFGGVWTMMFESERVFFRTGGSLAADDQRTDGLQLDAMRRLTGWVGEILGDGTRGANHVIWMNFSPYSSPVPSGSGGSGVYRLNFDSEHGGFARSGDDIRPTNRRIIVWKRTL
jgi:hypothetical protein